MRVRARWSARARARRGLALRLARLARLAGLAHQAGFQLAYRCDGQQAKRCDGHQAGQRAAFPGAVLRFESGDAG